MASIKKVIKRLVKRERLLIFFIKVFAVCLQLCPQIVSAANCLGFGVLNPISFIALWFKTANFAAVVPCCKST